MVLDPVGRTSEVQRFLSTRDEAGVADLGPDPAMSIPMLSETIVPAFTIRTSFAPLAAVMAPATVDRMPEGVIGPNAPVASASEVVSRPVMLKSAIPKIFRVASRAVIGTRRGGGNQASFFVATGGGGLPHRRRGGGRPAGCQNQTKSP